MIKKEKIKIGQFLFERGGKYKPKDKEIIGLKRLKKINFSGVFYIGEKESNTGMILIKKGDLVISGINVAKGAMGIYHENEDIAATIHYSSYTFDEKIIDIDYFEYFLKSSSFIKLLNEQTRGGIKTEIKPKHLLSLGIELPDIKIQKEVVAKIKNSLEKQDFIYDKIKNQEIVIQKLRKAILQDAIEGKLTADWRKKNPDIEPASELLKKIKIEKEKLIAGKKIKKDKPLPEILKEEIPFDLPKSWEWCQLGKIIRVSSGDGLTSSQMVGNGAVPVFGGNGINGYHIYNNIDKETIVIGRVGANCGSVHLTPQKAWVTDNAFVVHYFDGLIEREWLVWLLKSLSLGRYSFNGAQPVISGKKIYPLAFYLPPFIEQKAIVTKVENLMQRLDKLEAEISQNEKTADMLMQAVLKEAFEE